jgi:polyferredoxin
VSKKRRSWLLGLQRPKHRWQAALIIAAFCATFGALIAVSGYTRAAWLVGRRRPLSLRSSLIFGIVSGVVAFLLYTFRLWPFTTDPWGPPDDGEP